MTWLWRVPFALHVGIESVAVFLFVFRPELQLNAKESSPEAKMILRQYGALLASSNLICHGVMWQSEMSTLSRHIAVALVVYHVFPCYRALVRMRMPSGKAGTRVKEPLMANPVVHLVAHVTCCVLFVAVALI